MLQQWDHLLPQVLQRWNVDSGHLSAFSDGYRNACLLKDRVSPSPAMPVATGETLHYLSPIGWQHDGSTSVMPNACVSASITCVSESNDWCAACLDAQEPAVCWGL
jgi:hypothetical protein